MLLKSNRLTLTPFSLEDQELFHNTNTNPFVRKYLWDDEVIPSEVSTSILNEVEKRFNKEQWGLWKINQSETGVYVGYAGYWYFFDEPQPQLLYVLLPEHAGFGYATEAGRCLIQYAFDQLQFLYVLASMDKPNISSTKVCERLGMKLIEEKEIEGKPTLFYRIEKPN